MEARTRPRFRRASRSATSRRSARSCSERFGYSSAMQVPRIEKITLNMGVGEAKQDTQAARRRHGAARHDRRPEAERAPRAQVDRQLQAARGHAGRRQRSRCARARMYEILDRLMSIAIPRIRDFRGLNPRSFDGRGNYSMGVREQIIFPEIDYDAIDQVRGLDVTITTIGQDRRGGLRAAARARACRSRARARRATTGRRRAEARRGGAAQGGGARPGRGRAGRARGAQGGEPRGVREARAPPRTTRRRGRRGRSESSEE